MKKIIAVFLILITLLFVSCNGNDGGNVNGTMKAVTVDQYGSISLDAVNYDMSDIPGMTKIAEEGVLYVFCSNAKNANATISSLNDMLGGDAQTYDESDTKHLVLTVVTLGEGEKSTYTVEKVEMGENASMHVFVKTEGGAASDAKKGTYHFMRVDTPVCGKVNVYLDGELITK